MIAFRVSGFIRSLGADHVIDYTRENYTKNRNHYDLILDLTAYRSAFAYARPLKSNGAYYMVGGSVATIFQILFLRPLIKRMISKRVRMLMVSQNRKDLLAITELIQADKIRTVIDRIYPFNQIPEAMHHVSDGRAKGKVVITVK